MAGYIARRLLLMVPTLLGILLVTFTVIQFVPGGPVEQMVQMLREGGPGGPGGPGAAGGPAGGEVAATSNVYRGNRGVDAQKLAEIRALYGFDQPVATRFWKMVRDFARLDLGRSFFHDRSVWQLIRDKLPVSISLGLWTFLLTYLISIPLGIAKAVRHGSRFDVMSSTFILVGYAIPGFVLGVALLALFGGGSLWQLFPLRGLTSPGWEAMSWPARILDYFWHLTLPLICMVIGSFAVTTMLTKNTVLEEIRKQYVTVARAKGLGERQILYKHVFRNAMIPIVTGFPAAFIGAFFTGSLLIETLFSLDGLGLLSYDSVMRRDYPVVMGSLYVFSIIGLLAKLVNDLLYVWVDPRIQYSDLDH